MSVDQLRLLASAIAGRTVDVVHADPGARTWTDGSTIHLDESLNQSDAVVALAVQASLLASGSLDPTIVSGLHRPPAVARRYLAVEGHRALAEQEQLLPPVVRRVGDHGVAESSASPEASAVRARQRDPLAPPPVAFGELRIKPLLVAAERSQSAAASSGPTHVPPKRQSSDLDTLEEGPFYAIRLEAGDLGTKGGIVTDAQGRALSADGSPIEGLYATGNVSAAVMGNEYAGAGATIGPAMVFSYLAMEHAAMEKEAVR